MTRLEMKIDNMILTKKPAKILKLWSRKLINMTTYRWKNIIFYSQSIDKTTKFAYSPLGKDFEKPAMKNEGEKEIKPIEENRNN